MVAVVTQDRWCLICFLSINSSLQHSHLQVISSSFLHELFVYLLLQMARAGFIHTPSGNSPDIAMCFFCLKELEGWEPEDDPE